jgi:DNA anti-recombination protein RmuC
MLSRSLDSLNIDIKRKFDEYLDIARETGKTEFSDGQVLQSLAQKRVDRIEDEIMRLENQLAIDAKDAPEKATLIEQRLTQLRKSRDERWAEIRKDTERSADLETRKRDLDQLQAIAAEMSTRLNWMDIDANAPDRIRQVQPAAISPQAISSRLVPTARSVVSSQ